MFYIDLLLEGLRYLYAFSYDGTHTTNESLRVYDSRKSQRWFERNFDEQTQKECWTTFSSAFRGAHEMWRKATTKRALFLTTAGQLNACQIQPVLGSSTN
jgi:uncharacterized protein